MSKAFLERTPHVDHGFVLQTPTLLHYTQGVVWCACAGCPLDAKLFIQDLTLGGLGQL